MAEDDTIRTNRALYLFVADLCGHHRESDRSLEEYLRALWQLGVRERTREALPLPRFAALLAEAFEAEPADYDASWEEAYTRDLAGVDGYERWERTILRQVVDLHEMLEAGTLYDELRYFGIYSPRGARWYNFDPCTFLECGVAGTFGGWQSGDETGRDYVPGPVAVLDEVGRVVSVDPRDVPNPTLDLGAISWESFKDFLGSGQWYE